MRMSTAQMGTRKDVAEAEAQCMVKHTGVWYGMRLDVKSEEHFRGRKGTYPLSCWQQGAMKRSSRIQALLLMISLIAVGRMAKRAW